MQEIKTIREKRSDLPTQADGVSKRGYVESGSLTNFITQLAEDKTNESDWNLIEIPCKIKSRNKYVQTECPERELHALRSL